MKIACLISAALPSLSLSIFMDSFPESGRPLASKQLFFFFNIGVLLFMVYIGLGLSKFEDYVIKLVNWACPISAFAVGAAGTMLLFGLKTMSMSLFSPLSLVVVRSDVVSRKVDHALFSLLKSTNSLVKMDAKLGRQRKV